MNISAPFIARPVATILLTIAIALAGILGYLELPVAPLPQVDFPTISVNAQLPGASPDTVATSLTAPLERHLGEIADVTEMTSQSQVGQARIILQFDLSRDINGAASDVQAAINAAQADLPSNLITQPTYHKVNPADAPVVILALTSKTLTRGQMYDSASTVMQQQLSQLAGVGQVIISGSALPAVRVELNPQQLFHYGIGLEDVRSALGNTNANAPKGAIDVGAERWQVYTNDQANHAEDYRPVVVAYRNGDAVRLRDVADVQDSVQDLRNLGLANGRPAVLVIVFRQPGANIVSTVDGVRAAIPKLRAALPSDINISVASDQSITIRSSLATTRMTLLIAMLLVVAVVYVYLRNWRVTFVPAVAVPVSIIGTFGAMYLLGYSLDNLSLMALTISTGFVVDDAIVVVENISRHLEEGMSPVEAALRGAGEVGFTVVSITASLIAVFLPLLLMGGIIGRLFQEFAMTLSLAICISMAISLTTTPMLSALLLRRLPARGRGRPSFFMWMQNTYQRTLAVALDHSVLVLLILVAVIAINFWLIVTIPKGFFPQEDTGRMGGTLQADQDISFQLMSKKFTQMMSIVQHDPAVQSVVGYTGSGSGGGGGQTNTAFVYVSLKPLDERDSITTVMNRLRRSLSHIPGGVLRFRAFQDIRVGGRSSSAEYQYTLLGDTTAEVYQWAPKLTAAMQKDPTFLDVNSDQQQGGAQTGLTVNRDAASRLGLTLYQIDNTLYDAFGQRSVSTIYNALNQYHVVMEVAPKYWQRPSTLDQIWVSTSGAQPGGSASTQLSAGTVTAPVAKTGPAAITPPVRPSLSSLAASQTNSPTVPTANATVLATNPLITSSNITVLGQGGGVASTAVSSASSATSSAANNAVRTAAQASLGATGKSVSSTGAAVATSVESMVPLSAVASWAQGNMPLAVNHQSEYVATTISFNLPANKSLSQAQTAIENDSRAVHMPSDLIGGFAGTALVYEQSLSGETFLVIAALAAIYIVLGVLYESFMHPLTIMSTLPSASLGAFLALEIFGIQFTIMALIGVILLLGIVKKNAILMVDFALKAERDENMDSREAIFTAAVLRFRPIMMTTTAALLGAVPLCLPLGFGSELRQPLGISIVGGLIVSQVLTLYTTPIVYLWLDRLRLRATQMLRGRSFHPRPQTPTANV
ncbi:MAG TPA: efflux RND transporter permease subunit [Rhizomicrobium sp.]|jgi:multidrug efflux pump|nr:efflux RND transporter permease subunit [Rhizomicrobium sp.]